ncbi:MAG: type IX secretion system membrane protein PorP/SprF [Bacteroidota bacterium]
MRRILLVFLFMMSVALPALAQQDPLYAQYFGAPMVINPAYAGFTKDVNAAVIYRKQWAGFDGSPTTVNASGSISLLNNKVGAGLMVVKDAVGSNKTTEIQGVYAYHLPVGENTTFSFGLQAGGVNYRSDYSQLTINPNDPKFSSYSEWRPTFGAGVQLTNDKFFLSVSMPKMLQSNNNSPAAGLYNRNFYGLASYIFPVSYRIKLKPFMLLRASSNSPVALDAGLAVHADDSYRLGVFTRNLSTYGFQAQIKLGDAIRMGYVFEMPTSKSVGLKFPTHELMLGVRFATMKFHDIEAVRNF